MGPLVATREQLLDTIRRAQARGFLVVAPVRERGEVYFRQVDGPDVVALDAPNPLNPPKDFLLPVREELAVFEVEGRRVKVAPSRPPEGRALLLGVRPCDLAGIALLDRIFGRGQFVDDRYTARREGTLLWAFACTPRTVRPTCFCNWFGLGPGRKEGADIFSVDLGGGRLLVEPLTVRGAEFLGEFGPDLEEAVEEDLSRAELAVKQAEGALPERPDLERASARMAEGHRSPLWAGLARMCVSCGICAFYCPCCFCFFVSDETAGDRGVRVRGWDSCCFPEYMLHADGHNPRPDPAARLEHRFSHKFVHLPEEAGSLGCTGCGRCVSLCPVGMDVREVLRRWAEEGQEEQH